MNEKLLSEQPERIRLLVVDDHTIIRKGIRAVLDLVPDIDLVGEAENGKQAIQKDQELTPDVILMDLMMPEMDGIECIRQIKSRRPQARILVLTNFAGEDMIFPAIKAGAMGYHLKDSSPEALVEAIRQGFRGESFLHPLIAKKILEELHAPQEHRITSEPLTHREVEVLRLERFHLQALGMAASAGWALAFVTSLADFKIPFAATLFLGLLAIGCLTYAVQFLMKRP